MQFLPKILLVEDDRSIASALAQALQNIYDVDVAASGRLALYKTDIEHYELIMLDLNLPDITGTAICQQLRERGVGTPILILTGESSVMTKINLLDSGANDYLTKPFSLGELKARLRALARRETHFIAPSLPLAACGLVLDRKNRQVTRDSIPITLRRKEFALLEYLMEHAGAVVTRRALLNYAWEGSDNIWTNTVDVHIKYLRDKIDRPFDSALIHTVHGLGYKLESTAVSEKISDPVSV